MTNPSPRPAEAEKPLAEVRFSRHEALMPYVQHLPGCKATMRFPVKPIEGGKFGYQYEYGPCTCKLAEVLAGEGEKP